VTVAERSPEFDTIDLNRYKADPDYRYEQKAPETSWLQAIWDRVVDYIKDLLSNNSSYSQRLLSILLIAGAVIIMGYFLAKARFLNIFSRNDRRKKESIRILNAEVEVDQISQRISNALEEKDYRAAYRWVYIDLLHQLGRRKLVRLHGNKTNRDYKEELAQSVFHTEFAFLADAFDFVWYGEHAIDQPTFETYQGHTRNILNAVSI
jgi:hypothetical protein